MLTEDARRKLQGILARAGCTNAASAAQSIEEQLAVRSAQLGRPVRINRKKLRAMLPPEFRARITLRRGPEPDYRMLDFATWARYLLWRWGGLRVSRAERAPMVKALQLVLDDALPNREADARYLLGAIKDEPLMPRPGLVKITGIL